MRKLWYSLFLCTLGLLGVQAAAQQAPPGSVSTLTRITESGTLRVGVNPEFKPFSFVADGERTGVDIDLAGLLAEELGVGLELVTPEAFSELIPMVNRGEIDIVMAGMSITFERAKEVAFSAPYYHTGLSILANKGRLARLGVGEASSYEALVSGLEQRGNAGALTVAVTENRSPAASVPQFFPAAQVKTYPDNDASAQAVLEGDADIMVHDEIFLKVWLQDNRAQTEFRMVVFEQPFKPDYYGFAVAQGDQAWLNLIDVFVLEIGREGYLNRFLTNYLDPAITVQGAPADTPVPSDTYYPGD